MTQRSFYEGKTNLFNKENYDIKIYSRLRLTAESWFDTLTEE